MDRFSYNFSVKKTAFETPLCFVMKIHEIVYCDFVQQFKFFRWYRVIMWIEFIRSSDINLRTISQIHQPSITKIRWTLLLISKISFKSPWGRGDKTNINCTDMSNEHPWLFLQADFCNMRIIAKLKNKYKRKRLSLWKNVCKLYLTVPLFCIKASYMRK